MGVIYSRRLLSIGIVLLADNDCPSTDLLRNYKVIYGDHGGVP
jgi:hypothetical protein